MSKLTASFIASLALLTTASGAFAQPGAEPAPPPPVPAPADAAVAATGDAGIQNDVNADRVWLTPTALTQPKGTWSFNDVELMILGLTYGVTDTLQVSAKTWVLVDSEQPFLLWLTAKKQLISDGKLRLAIDGSWISVDDEAVGVVGSAATLCLDDGCHSLINGYLGTAFAITQDTEDFPVIASLALVKKMSRRVKFIAEVDTGWEFGEDPTGNYLGWYGVRFASGEIGGDIGFVKPFGEDVDEGDEFPMGFPMVTFTYRSN